MIKQINLITYALDNINKNQMKNINKNTSREALIDQAANPELRKSSGRGTKNDSAPSETKVSK